MRDSRGRRAETSGVRHLLQPEPLERHDDDDHLPLIPPQPVTHDGRPCWQITLEPPRPDRGDLSLVVDPGSALCVQHRNDEATSLLEVTGLRVDGALDPEMLQAALAREAKEKSEGDLYDLVLQQPPPTPAWFPWRRGWAEHSDCWIVEVDSGSGSVGRAPLDQAAPVATTTKTTTASSSASTTTATPGPCPPTRPSPRTKRRVVPATGAHP